MEAYLSECFQTFCIQYGLKFSWISVKYDRLPQSITLLSATSKNLAIIKSIYFFKLIFLFTFILTASPSPQRRDFPIWETQASNFRVTFFPSYVFPLYFYIHEHACTHKTELLFVVLSQEVLWLSSGTESAIFLTTQAITCSNGVREKNKNTDEFQKLCFHSWSVLFCWLLPKCVDYGHIHILKRNLWLYWR